MLRTLSCGSFNKHDAGPDLNGARRTLTMCISTSGCARLQISGLFSRAPAKKKHGSGSSFFKGAASEVELLLFW